MNPHLSVILPVHNAQDRLVERVSTLLETVPDLTPLFDVTIVDDGSTDHTFELAQELARHYPQVRVVRHAMSHGHAVSVETGLRNTTGDVVFVQDEHAPVSPAQLRRLWRTRADQRLVMADSPSEPAGQPSRILQRLTKWAAALNAESKARTVDRASELIRGTKADRSDVRANPLSRVDADHDRRADEKESESSANSAPKYLFRPRDIAGR